MSAQVKLLELAERGRAATALLPAVRPQPAEQQARPRVEAGSLHNDRPPECPACGSGASRDGKRLACCWCGCVTERGNGGWSVVDACRLYDGSWAENERQTGSST